MRISVINALTMDAHELREIVSRDIRLHRQFLGVFAADVLPSQIPVGSLAIINSCDRTEPGKHSLYISNKYLCNTHYLSRNHGRKADSSIFYGYIC